MFQFHAKGNVNLSLRKYLPIMFQTFLVSEWSGVVAGQSKSVTWESRFEKILGSCML